jgi:ABC-type transport system involved in cytochrome c biogenesis permease subunit
MAARAPVELLLRASAEAFMTNPETPATPRKANLWPSRLWITAGVIVLIGFILRPLGSYLGRELRYAGIIVIAIGAIVALIAWADERWSRSRSGD